MFRKKFETYIKSTLFLLGAFYFETVNLSPKDGTYLM